MADVGISVDGAADVAKEAADLILLEHDLGVLRAGVLEGRRTLGNIVKYVLMGTSSNFGNMFSMAGAALVLPFLPMRPIQILVNNFLYDLSEVAIPTDNVDDEFVARPHRWDMRFLRRFMMVIGPVSSVFDFATFYLLYVVLRADQVTFQTGWFVESLATQDRWTLLVVRDLLGGAHRFRDLQTGLPGLAPNILSERLKLMEERGLVKRRFYTRFAMG